MTFIYLDIETTGLDPLSSQIVEIAFTVGDGPVYSGVVKHSLSGANPKALEINRYFERGLASSQADPAFEENFREAVQGATTVGANPAFDTAFLRARWGSAPWKYRLLDVEAYAMPVLGFETPKGLAAISEELTRLGYPIPQPDHSAAADVEATRACHLALVELAEKMRAT